MKQDQVRQKKNHQIKFKPYFSTPDVHPFEQIEWEKRSAELKDWKSGKVSFHQDNLEFPSFWSQRASDIVASKYFRGQMNTPSRESSIKQLIGRITETITSWGEELDFFASPANAVTFKHELCHILVHQMAAFNSPVQFNVGFEKEPQCSACFINAVDDSMESIMDLAKTEAMIFKGGSGSGVNLSRIRSSNENLSAGGIASGPVSFMRGFDSFAGAIKSGGATRRAAKMAILNADHPDIREFILCKAKEEKKALKLIEAGYDSTLDGEAYQSVQFQNANNSVSVLDKFMEAVLSGGDWSTKLVTTGEVDETHKAADIFSWISDATWECGDPGIQFSSTMNDWHTCPNTGPINASNPCSEFVFLDNSACNLASLNLLRFLDDEGNFKIADFQQAVRTLIIAQEIIVDKASYPTPEITRNTHLYRPLGLGFANLGALLMANGLPYDSDGARALAAAVTALMTGEAYRASSELAGAIGAFEGFEKNRIPMMRVMHKHREALSGIDLSLVPGELIKAAEEAWDEAIINGSILGFRNAQVTVLAPTGTIAFMMDCDTTGIEPEFSLVKYKKLVGGGTLKIVNNTITAALKGLGYGADKIEKILEYLENKDTVEGAPGLKKEHLPLFDCADRPVNGSRSIHYMGHIKMCGALQPFISGAISKTVNMPHEITAGEIRKAYIFAWKAGMKAISIYRDGCKSVQPLSNKERVSRALGESTAQRNMPKDHSAIQHEFRIKGFKGFLTMGIYPEDDRLGEIFINFSKQGSTLQGMAMAWAIAISMGLQRGVPLEDYVRMFSHMSFEPAGFTDNPQIPFASSIPDYVVRCIASKFLSPEAQIALGIHNVKPDGADQEGVQLNFPNGNHSSDSDAEKRLMADAYHSESMTCECGGLMQRNGSCHVCTTCGRTSGCS